MKKIYEKCLKNCNEKYFFLERRKETQKEKLRDFISRGTLFSNKKMLLEGLILGSEATKT